MTPHAQSPHFLCGHEKAGNSLPNGNRVRCRICTVMNRQDRHGPRPSVRAPRANPYPEGCDAIRLYEAEKQKRAEKAQPEMDAARTAFFALLDKEKQQGRGGRPRRTA